ncbi:hypothetical protein NDK25_19800 [Niallia taxi]|nr:hypothetical protein [Niallia taxi]
MEKEYLWTVKEIIEDRILLVEKDEVFRYAEMDYAATIEQMKESANSLRKKTERATRILIKDFSISRLFELFIRQFETQSPPLP